MGLVRILVIAALAGMACPTPAFAEQRMQNSPLMMRRAGPSCQPGNLEGEAGAGYGWRLGPCAGPYQEKADAAEGIDVPRGARPVRRR